MKVAYVTPFYNGECEGRFGRFHDWVHALRDMDDPPFEFDVHAVMAANPDEALASKPSEWLGSGDELYGTKRNNLQYLTEIRRIRCDIHESDPDIIHLIAFDPLLLLPVIDMIEDKAMVLGPNVGGWYPIREDEVWLTGSSERVKHRAKYRLRKQLVRRLDYDRVLAFSDYHRRMLRLLDIRDEHISMLRPGVDGRFAPRGESKISEPPYELLYVGALTEHKGYPLFLRALNQLDANVHARVVGGGDPNEDLIQSLGLTDRIIFEGFVNRADLPDLYTGSDLFVLPSIDEMGANTQIEALASGTPVISTDVVGLNYLDEDSAIRYFDPRTPSALKQTITSALNEIRDLTHIANRQSYRYNIINTIDGLKKTYAEV